MLKNYSVSSDITLKLQGIGKFSSPRSITRSGYELDKNFIDLKR